MGVSSKVTINQSRLSELSKAAITALERTCEALHTEVVQAEIMPREFGTLQNEKTFVDYSKSSQGVVTLVSEGPYARRLYFHPEYNFSQYENAFAGGRWLEPWMKGGVNEKFCQRAFARFFKRAANI